MSAPQYNLKISRGEDFSFTLRLLNSFKEPVLLTSAETSAHPATFKSEIREEYKKPLVQSLAVTALGDGVIYATLTHAQTLTFDTNKRYKWDLFWTDNTGSAAVVHKLLYGDVIVSPNITNI